METEQYAETAGGEPEVLVEGSYFRVADLATLLGKYMRAADESARQAKEALQQRDELRDLLTTPLPASSSLHSGPTPLPTSWTAIRAVVQDYGWLTIVGPDPEGIWRGEGTWHEAEHIQSWEPLLTESEWRRSPR